MEINKNLKKSLENNKILKALIVTSRDQICRIFNKNKIILSMKIQTLEIKCIKLVSKISRIRAIMIIMNSAKNFLINKTNKILTRI